MHSYGKAKNRHALALQGAVMRRHGNDGRRIAKAEKSEVKQRQCVNRQGRGMVCIAVEEVKCAGMERTGVVVR